MNETSNQISEKSDNTTDLGITKNLKIDISLPLNEDDRSTRCIISITLLFVIGLIIGILIFLLLIYLDENYSVPFYIILIIFISLILIVFIFFYNCNTFSKDKEYIIINIDRSEIILESKKSCSKKTERIIKFGNINKIIMNGNKTLLNGTNTGATCIIIYIDGSTESLSEYFSRLNEDEYNQVESILKKYLNVENSNIDQIIDPITHTIIPNVNRTEIYIGINSINSNQTKAPDFFQSNKIQENSSQINIEDIKNKPIVRNDLGDALLP